jgi:hypothetical protein
MCLISRWPASRGDHLFIVERAVCVISRYPFFDFLSFLLRNVAEHDRSWMTERLSKLQVQPELMAHPKPPLALPAVSSAKTRQVCPSCPLHPPPHSPTGVIPRPLPPSTSLKTLFECGRLLPTHLCHPLMRALR